MSVLDEIVPLLTVSYWHSADVEADVRRLRGEGPSARPARGGWVAQGRGEFAFVIGKAGPLAVAVGRVLMLASEGGVPAGRIRNEVGGSAAEFRAALRDGASS